MKHELRFALVAVFGAGLAIFGAACTGTNGPTISQSHRAIINGVLSGSDDDAAIGLGLFDGNGQFMGACSGVLVAENLVLTARHCVSQVDDSGIACQSDGTPIAGGEVYGDYDPTQLKVLLGSTLSADFAATGMQILHPDGDNLCNLDIAMIVLDQKIVGGTIAQLRLDSAPLITDTIRAVGWGVANNSNALERRKRDDIPIVEVGPVDDDGLGAREFAIGEGICSGDSGGPAFVESSKAVIGTVSRGGNGAPYNPNTDPQYTDCVDKNGYVTNNIYTRTDGFKDFILSGFAAAGADPWVEGGPDPRKAKFGEACSSDNDCRSAVCEQNLCTETCTRTKDFDSCTEPGYSCQTQKADGRDVCEIQPKKKSGCSLAPASPAATESTAFTFLLVAGALAFANRRRLASR